LAKTGVASNVSDAMVRTIGFASCMWALLKSGFIQLWECGDLFATAIRLSAKECS
jgi:hypothetical protein